MGLLRRMTKPVRRAIQRRGRNYTYDYRQKPEDLVPDAAVDKGFASPEEIHERSKRDPPRREPRVPDNYDAEAEAMRTDYRDDLSLDELEQNDIAMTQDAIKDAKRYVFNTAVAAQAFVGRCLETTLKRCGCPVFQGADKDILQRQMDQNKVQVENRSKAPAPGYGSFYKGADAWRNGLYVYKAGELVAFISVPMVDIQAGLAIDDRDVVAMREFMKVARDGQAFKHDPGAAAVRTASEFAQAGGKPFVITNAVVDMKGYR